MKSIHALLSNAVARLQHSDSPQLDARVLLSHCLGQSQSYLMTWPEQTVEPQQVAQFEALVQQREEGYPIAHLIGYRDFWTLHLQVSPATLIPRPETELLVEQALNLSLPEEARVLDLGTGTGAIALALAAERPAWQVTGVDLSEKAIALAKANARHNQLSDTRFVCSDWFDAIVEQQFDLIVSNPPYVERDSPYLQQGDVRFEPLSALTSGVDGLDDIRHISARSVKYLTKNGVLMFEHGHQQGEQVQQIMHQCGLSELHTVDDLNHLPRVTFGKRHG